MTTELIAHTVTDDDKANAAALLEIAELLTTTATDLEHSDPEVDAHMAALFTAAAALLVDIQPRTTHVQILLDTVVDFAATAFGDEDPPDNT